MRKIGDKVRVSRDNDNDGYDGFRDAILIITHVATSVDQHAGYDESMGGIPLYDFETASGDPVHSSLYEYEIESYYENEPNDTLLKLAFILDVGYQEHDLDMIGRAADMIKALAIDSNDTATIDRVNRYFGDDWTIAAVNEEYGFNY